MDDAYVAALMSDFDTDGSGKIEIAEIEQVLKFLKIGGSPGPALGPWRVVKVLLATNTGGPLSCF